MKKLILSFIAILASTGLWAGIVTVPTTAGAYISTTEAVLGNCNPENNGRDIGSTHNGSTMTISLNNTTAGDYFLQFLSGASGLTATVNIHIEGGSFDQTQSFNIANTGSWTPSELHCMELKDLPSGALTLKLTVTSTTGGYAGNYGSFAINPTSNYDQCPGNITLDKGAYQTARVEAAGNVGYCSNGATATYTVYNTVAGTATLNMGLVRYGDGTVTVTVTDLTSGNVEITKQFITTADLCKGYDNPSAIELGEITKGLKAIKLSFAISSGFICNYKNVSIGVKPEWKNIAQNTEDDVFEIGTASASTIYYTVNNDGTLTSQATADGAIGELTAKWSGTSHGYLNFANKITIPAGIFKIGLGTCQYGTGTSSITDETDNALTVRTADGVDVTSFNTNDGTCYHQNKTTNITYVYYPATEEQTIIIKSLNYVPFFSIEAATSMPALSTKYNVTYSKNDASIIGNVPATENVVVGSQVTIPANHTLYKEGYTLTGWSDGEQTYAAGTKLTVNNDINLSPVFRQNTQNINTRYDAVAIVWDFQRKNGAPTFNLGGNTAGMYITQATVNEEVQDIKMEFNTKTGKLANSAWTDWAQLNGGFEFYLPSCNGAIVSMETYSASAATTVDGVALTGNSSKTPSVTVASDNNPITVVYGSDASYFRWISITLPKNANDPSGTNPWDNYTDFALDLTNGAYIHETETNVITIGFKQDGDNIVRCAADDADAIGTVAGKFHSNEHGLQNFSMKVAVPGYVKIEAGTCAWGGNLTISGTNGFTTTVNTNNGTCFHQDKAKNKVVAYYTVNEGTTLTISGGNYMPYIAVTQVNEVPTAHTVTFKNGENVVSTKSVYEGTAIGTLPTVTTGANEYFLGWYSDADDITTKISTATIINTDVTYYANIVPLYTNAEGQLTPQAGDAKSFLAHLAKANETSGVIYLANGTYDLATLINTEVKNNVVILGESREGVIIVNHPAQAGMSSSETLNLTGNNIYMQHLTVRCDVSYPGSVADGVGTAIRTYGDKNIFYDIDMQGNQDTYNTPMKVNARAYVKACRIEGTVDYICGSGNIWFEAVDLYMNARSNADVIVAPSTSADTEYGYVFNGCTIDGDAAQAGRYNLARGWQGSPAATWINTTCLINPSAKGYVFMHDPLTVRFHEYNTMDKDGNAITGHNLSGLGYDAASDAIYLNGIGDYTYANVVMGTDGWDPESIILYYNRVHVRNIAAGEYGTICLPYNATATGAVIMSVIGRNEDGTGIVCKYVGDTEAESYTLQAGQAYIYRATAGEQTFAITAENANDYVQPAQTDYMVGTFSALTLESGKYFLYPVDQMFHPAGDNVLIPAYRCYLNTDNVMNMSPAEVEAPTRMVVFGVQRPVMTGVDNTTDHRASKVLVDGHLYILRGDKVINL